MPTFYKCSIIILLLTAVISCDGSLGEEIARVTSPDKMVDAVLIRNSAGATTPLVYKLYLVQIGGEPRKGHECLVADHIENLKIRWKQLKFLEIQYDQARIYSFRNFWRSKHLENFKYVVELRLRPQSDTFSLSAKDRYE